MSTAVIRFYYTDRLFSQVLRHFLSFFAARLLGKPHIHYPYPDAYTNNAFATLFDVPRILDRTATHEAVLEMQRSRVVNGDGHLQFLDQPPALKHDYNYDSPTDLSVGDSHRVSSFSSLQRSQTVQQWCDQTIGNHFKIEDLFSEAHIEIMRQAYRFTKHTATRDASALNVAVHIRRGDIAQYPTESRYTRLPFFVDTIRHIQTVLPQAHIHVYSDSAVELDLPNIRYHILEDLLETMHDMIHADILVMSVGSNMSFFAGLMSRGIVYFDPAKLEEPFNAELNRYWSKHPHFLNTGAFEDRLNELADSRS